MFPFDTNREPPQSSIFYSSFIINSNLQKWDDFLRFQPHLWDDFLHFQPHLWDDFSKFGR